MATTTHDAPIEGTVIFNGAQAMKGYALNALCFSFNDAANRHAFLDDEAEYCSRFNLTPEQLSAVQSRKTMPPIGTRFWMMRPNIVRVST